MTSTASACSPSRATNPSSLPTCACISPTQPPPFCLTSKTAPSTDGGDAPRNAVSCSPPRFHDYLLPTWPLVQQVAQLTRTLTELRTRNITEQFVYLLTDLTPALARPRQLLDLNR